MRDYPILCLTTNKQHTCI